MNSAARSTIAINPQSQRKHGFDSLRAFAAVLVVMLHAAHAYIPDQMPGLIWPAHDSEPSATVAGLFWWIEGFIMPLFLLMSGYFAIGLLQRLGKREFLRHRVRRLIAPLLFACVFILPLDFYAWGMGMAMDGRTSWRKLRSLKFEPHIADKLWGLSHLWYLQYLFAYCLMLIAVRVIAKRLRIDSLSCKRLALALLPCFAAFVLFCEPEVVIGFQHGFLPHPAKFSYSGTFFFAGALLAAMPTVVARIQVSGTYILAASLPLAFLMVHLTNQYFNSGFSQQQAGIYAVVTTGFAWLTVIGLTGRFLRQQRPGAALIQRIAAASFWIYLLHHPLVGFFQALLGAVAVPSLWKFAIVTCATLIICQLSWDFVVANSWAGRLLTGKSKARKVDDQQGQVVPIPQTQTRRKAS